jgi:hypothetical protein
VSPIVEVAEKDCSGNYQKSEGCRGRDFISIRINRGLKEK